ncbi:MAG: beta-lactamase family protein [Clostridia bacterium]|nr:beta-lactamase family protein [Clostridia bacterium]
MGTIDSAFLLERLVEGWRTGCFPSAAAAVGIHDNVIAEACTGEAPLPGQKPVDRHTRYDMASLSKILGPTMIALRALSDGTLSLTETVGDFFPDAPSDKQSITVFMLMTHTGGFTPAFRLDRRGIEREAAIREILMEPLIDKPGTKVPHYSCMGYILFAKMLEKRFGKPLNVLAEERVFKPLGMQETGYCPAEGTVCAATEIDPGSGQPIIGVVHDENARFLGGVSGNAGVFMPLADGIRFASALSKRMEGLVSPDVFNAAVTNYTPGQDEHRGLGFQMSGSPMNFMSTAVPPTAFGHTGFTGTSLMVEPETGLWVLLLSNRVYPTRESTALFPFRRKLNAEIWENLFA